MLSEQPTKVDSKVLSVQILRGFAAVMVCFFHFTNAAPDYLSQSNPLKEVFSFGKYGVQVFFVISGFVLPYSLYKANYHYNNFPRFLLKRLVRLEPAYFVCIVLVIVLAYTSTLSPYYRGKPFSVDYYNLLFHFGYLNVTSPQ